MLRAASARDDSAVLQQRDGVKVAFQSGNQGNAVDLMAQARAAVALGLPEEEAIRTLTPYPALIFGAADRIGSLETGKIGNLLAFAGNRVSELAPLRMTIVAGRGFGR